LDINLQAQAADSALPRQVNHMGMGGVASHALHTSIDIETLKRH
jgi:hypothetical protein